VGRATKIRDITREITKGSGEFTWGRIAHFSIQRVYKGGIKGTEVQMETGGGGGDCGYPFKKGESYLVYSYRESQSRKLETNICTRTRPLNMADDDLDYLNGLPNSDSITRISGTVWHVGNELNQFALVGPLTRTKVVITSNGQRFEAVTNDKGVYQATGLPPGDYTLAAELPPNLVHSFHVAQKFNLISMSCAGSDIYVVSNGRVSGRVLDSSGGPVAKIKVEITSANESDRAHHPGDEYAFSRSKWDFTDADGRFHIDKIPPGRYVLGFDVAKSPSKEARVITLGDGEAVEGIELRLPASPLQR
jgi:hypothetical protein